MVVLFSLTFLWALQWFLLASWWVVWIVGLCRVTFGFSNNAPGGEWDLLFLNF